MSSSPIVRRASTPVRIGSVTVGGGHPVVVQSMTNTDTADVEGTALQVRALAVAGSELVRVTVNTDEAAAAVPHSEGISVTPWEADSGIGYRVEKSTDLPL